LLVLLKKGEAFFKPLLTLQERQEFEEWERRVPESGPVSVPIEFLGGPDARKHRIRTEDPRPKPLLIEYPFKSKEPVTKEEKTEKLWWILGRCFRDLALFDLNLPTNMIQAAAIDLAADLRIPSFQRPSHRRIRIWKKKLLGDRYALSFGWQVWISIFKYFSFFYRHFSFLGHTAVVLV
jgi:hypothetical protein